MNKTKQTKAKSRRRVRWKEDGGDYYANVGKMFVLISWTARGDWNASVWTRLDCIIERVFPNLGLARAWCIRTAEKPQSPSATTK